MGEEVRILRNSGNTEIVIADLKPSVVVSAYLNEHLKLYNFLESKGIDTYISENRWPRDDFVHWKNAHIPMVGCGNIGSGGYFAFGRDFAMMSIVIKMPMGQARPAGLNRNEDYVKFLENLWQARVHPIVNYDRQAHIDLTVLPIPFRNMIIVDSRHYSQSPKQFNDIAKAHNQELVIADASNEGLYWPLNSLVVNSAQFVVANQKTPAFLKLLDNLKIDHLDLLVDGVPTDKGSIHCRTNEAINPVFLKDAYAHKLMMDVR
jgi:hypothetical protein